MLFLRYYLWIAPHLLCGIALLVALKKGIHRRFPAFVALLTFSFAVELLVAMTISLLSSQATYRWFLIFDGVAVFLLQLLVLVELARNVLFARRSLAWLSRPFPQWTAAALVLAAVTLAAFLPQASREQVMNVFPALNFGLNLVALGLLLAMLLFARLLGVSWRGIPAGIALGFGVMATVEMAASPLLSELGQTVYITVDMVRMVAFHIGVLVWFLYLLLPERSPRLEMEPQIVDLEARLQDLEKMAQR